jgi:zinc D-Ala-D-Ala carboxypeptidase
MTKNFTLEELTHTNYNIPNVPNAQQIEKLEALAINILQPARDKYGKAITVNSGFRSVSVNNKVGGSITSQHLYGEAADICCEDNAKLFEILKKLPFDQLIWEFGNDDQPNWIHVSYGSRNRRQILKSVKVVKGTIYKAFK